ncbi:MAG: hypothetical protein ABJA98_32555 [Acidobacteriota bacterium]
MPKTKIRTLDDFTTALKTLCFDLGRAADHYALFGKLLEARDGAFTKALSQSQTFWSMTYGAHFETAVFRLCRAYDQDLEVLALSAFLETIKAQPSFLLSSQMLQTCDQTQLAADLEWVSADKNPVVKNLMMWRHKVYAHRDVRKTVSGDIAAQYPISHTDMSNLLENGFDIVNRYNGVFFGGCFAREVHGLEDYENVLRTLQDSVEAIEAQFAAQMEQLKREME